MQSPPPHSVAVIATLDVELLRLEIELIIQRTAVRALLLAKPTPAECRLLRRRRVRCNVGDVSGELELPAGTGPFPAASLARLGRSVPPVFSSR